MNYYLDVIKKYAVFSGRARRKEYWMFALFNAIFALVAVLIDNVIGTKIDDLYYGWVYCIYLLAVVVPSLAVGVRRMHDVNKSGWFLLVSLIPIVGAIWLLVLACREGDSGENEYGADPKASA